MKKKFYNLGAQNCYFLSTEAMKIRASNMVPDPDVFGEYGMSIIVII